MEFLKLIEAIASHINIAEDLEQIDSVLNSLVEIGHLANISQQKPLQPVSNSAITITQNTPVVS